MGAAFDDDLITEVAKVISTEARAFNNANRTGLDFWTPVSVQSRALGLAFADCEVLRTSTPSETQDGDVDRRHLAKTLTISRPTSKP